MRIGTQAESAAPPPITERGQLRRYCANRPQQSSAGFRCARTQAPGRQISRVVAELAEIGGGSLCPRTTSSRPPPGIAGIRPAGVANHAGHRSRSPHGDGLDRHDSGRSAQPYTRAIASIAARTHRSPRTRYRARNRRRTAPCRRYGRTAAIPASRWPDCRPIRHARRRAKEWLMSFTSRHHPGNRGGNSIRSKSGPHL